MAEKFREKSRAEGRGGRVCLTDVVMALMMLVFVNTIVIL